MKKTLFAIIIILAGCTSTKKDNNYLVKIYEGGFDQTGVKTGYKNDKGDTIIPLGKYYYCYTDTIINYGIVQEKSGKLIAINANEEKLFEVYKSNDKPDQIADGLFRIVKDNKIGYANQDGKIVIEPKYQCAFPFNNGKARVSLNCELKSNGKHIMQISDRWIFINKEGQETEK